MLCFCPPVGHVIQSVTSAETALYSRFHRYTPSLHIGLFKVQYTDGVFSISLNAVGYFSSAFKIYPHCSMYSFVLNCRGCISGMGVYFFFVFIKWRSCNKMTFQENCNNSEGSRKVHDPSR